MDAIGMIEVTSIAVGYGTCDAMVKAASVKLLDALPMCPGKFIVLIGGDVADVSCAVEAGKYCAGDSLIDSLVIPRVHSQVFQAIHAATPIHSIEALGVLETFTAAAGIIAADAAVKAAAVELIEIRLSRGQGGKAFFSVSGEVGAVKAAIEAGAEAIRDQGSLVNRVIIPAPHPELFPFLL